MKLKLDDKGNVVVQDGKPVYIKDDNTEVAFDVVQAMQSNASLRRENQTHREARESAEGKLKVFEGVDPEAARKALETVSKLDAKQLVDSKGIEALRTQMTEQHAAALKAVEEKYAPVIQERDTFRDQLHAEKVGNAFATSKFVTDKLAVPVDMVQAVFGNSFKVEDGKVVAYNGKDKILSPSKMFAEPASFDEALAILVDGYASKNAILKGSGMNGGGSNGSGSGNGGKARYTRAEVDKMDPIAQGDIYRNVGEGKAEVVD